MRRFSVGHKYDPLMDSATWRDGYNPGFYKTDDPLKKVFIQSKLSANGRLTGSKTHAVAVGRAAEREAAELQVAETVKQAVAALEMALHLLNGIAAPSQYHHHVNQKQVHNAVFHLKTKCGVKFEDSEFSHRVSLA